MELVAYDLALTKVLSTATVNAMPVYHGDDVTFTIQVTNQGNVPASNIEITDYIPT